MKKREGGGLYNEYVYVHFFRNTLIKKTLFEKKKCHMRPCLLFFVQATTILTRKNLLSHELNCVFLRLSVLWLITI